ncbi:MAG: hypothetical protein H6760_01030 [Candidatus Nomurabacteria bacterium]|nr:MAG: hypothetical protein H6760_01030 [Candidatus Nomurabacteria bacterium]
MENMIPYLHKRQAMAVAREYGFSKETAGILGQSAQWTDWHRWNKCIPNAATPSTTEYGEPTDPKLASQATSAQLKEYIAQIQHSPSSERLVWLGFAIHLIQDLAVHQGMTNEEHAVRTLSLFFNPDWNLRDYARARKLLRRFMDALHQKIGDEAFDELRQSAGARPLNNSEREKLLGPTDFSLRSAVFGFMQKVFEYIFAKPERRRVRWDLDAVLSEGLR